MTETRVEGAGTLRTARGATAFLRRAAAFALVNAVLYLGVYAASEALVYRHGRRNPFFQVAATAQTRFDYVILGTSHAAVFNYRDMNARLESLSGARILNLSVVGGGPVVSALMFDYFRSRHTAGALIYVLDSFPFYSRQWNENRLQDSRLFTRAPFDPALARLLLRRQYSFARGVDYVSGFSKINNAERFAPDTAADEGPRFDRTYRPVRQLDEERLAYLYPSKLDPAALERYLAVFESVLASAHAAGMRVVVVKPPVPERILRLLPDEQAFNERISALLANRGLALHDRSRDGNDEKFFFDPDHLNQAGVTNFFEVSLVPLLRDSAPRPRSRRSSKRAASS